MIKSYFPTDPQRENADNVDLLETLGHIKKIIEANHSDSIFWAGDINSDFSRNSNHTRAVQDALQDLGLLAAWDDFDADFTCAHELLGRTFTSLLDHFFWNTTFSNSVTDAGVLHLPGNMSDHSPIFCTFDTSLIQEQSSKPSRQNPRPSWKRASTEDRSHYMISLEDRLSQLSGPDSVSACKNVHCMQPGHKDDLDQ